MRQKIRIALLVALALSMCAAAALAATGAMGLSVSDMEEALRIRMKPKLLEMNMKALHMGAECVTER